MIEQTLKDAAENQLLRLYHTADIFFSRHFPLPELTYRKSGKHAGSAFLNQNRINLNPVLFSENRDEFIQQVIPHEVSHLLVHQLYGKVKPHGLEWQFVMKQVFKQQPHTTHNFDLAPLNIKSIQYRCNCGTIALTMRRHNRVLKGQKYICKKCKSILKIATDH